MSAANAAVLDEFELHMRISKFSPVTIKDRLEVVRRLADWLPCPLLEATDDDLARYQQQFHTLARAIVDIYTRHIQAFYRWALAYGHVDRNPCGRLVKVRVRRGVPHPIGEDDLRLALACATGPLRLALILAAFAGLRRGEICRLRGEDLQLRARQPMAFIQGKGDKERRVPLLPPVVEELIAAGQPRPGFVVTHEGQPYVNPTLLSVSMCKFFRSIGIQTTLHSCRHYFATEVATLTRDLLLVRDLLGHSSLQTTQIYLASTVDGANDRLAQFATSAAALLTPAPN